MLLTLTFNTPLIVAVPLATTGVLDAVMALHVP